MEADFYAFLAMSSNGRAFSEVVMEDDEHLFHGLMSPSQRSNATAVELRHCCQGANHWPWFNVSLYMLILILIDDVFYEPYDFMICDYKQAFRT